MFSDDMQSATVEGTDISTLRVLHVVSSLDVRDGGTTSAVKGLALAQASAGASVTVLATFRRGFDRSAVDTLRNAGLQVILVGPGSGPLVWHRGISAATYSAIQHSDIVHIHALWEEIQHRAAVVARQLKVPYIISPHGMLDPWSLSQSSLKKRLYLAFRLRKNIEGSAALHYTANAEKKLAEQLKNLPHGLVIPNGIDFGECSNPSKRGSFRARYQIQSNVPLVLFLGRLHPVKGCDLLIKGFAQAIAGWDGESSPKPLLVIAGPDTNGYREKLEGMASEYGIGKSVLFVGPLYDEDKLAAFSDADLFGLISHHENFGIAVVEALAAGCPVLLSDQVGIHDFIEAERVGWVVPTRVDATANELRAWLKRDEDMTVIRDRARAAASRYDWKMISSAWVAQYQRIISSTRLPVWTST